MKKLIILTILSTIVISINAQISTNSWHDGYWGEWRNQYMYTVMGNYTGFVVYEKGHHPSEYFFQFQIYSYSYIEPTKKVKKEMIKLNKWYEYKGYVEYYVTEQYPTINAVLKHFNFPVFNSDSGSPGNPCVKRTAEAVISIAAYKDHPKCYSIKFDNVAIGIDLGNMYFLQ